MNETIFSQVDTSLLQPLADGGEWELYGVIAGLMVILGFSCVVFRIIFKRQEADTKDHNETMRKVGDAVEKNTDIVSKNTESIILLSERFNSHDEKTRERLDRIDRFIEGR